MMKTNKMDQLLFLHFSRGFDAETRYRQLGRTTALAKACKEASERLGEHVYLLCATDGMARDVSRRFDIKTTADIKWLAACNVKFIVDTSVYEVALREMFRNVKGNELKT